MRDKEERQKIEGALQFASRPRANETYIIRVILHYASQYNTGTIRVGTQKPVTGFFFSLYEYL
jgi:hypothetical protein